MYEGKVRWDLLPPGALACAAQVHGFGAEKYAPWDWIENPQPMMEHLRAALGHIYEFINPDLDDLDYESGLCVLGHAMARLHMAYTQWEQGIGVDDRPVFREGNADD